LFSEIEILHHVHADGRIFAQQCLTLDRGRYIHATTWTERIADKQWKKLNTLRPGDKIINTQFIVLEKRTQPPHISTSICLAMRLPASLSTFLYACVPRHFQLHYGVDASFRLESH
jgi:hypothetical protein